MPPVLSALFAFVVTGFQSRPALPLKILALQHQGAVYTPPVRTSSTHEATPIPGITGTSCQEMHRGCSMLNRVGKNIKGTK